MPRNAPESPNARRGLLALLAAPALLAGCSVPPRLPAVPRPETRRASALGLPNERFFFALDTSQVDAEFQAATRREATHRGVSPRAVMPAAELLSVSGGGEDGAFGAGLLCGWSEAGTRPAFNLVTGVSTGALTAPFAFLGPRYDPVLREVYTNTTLRDVAAQRSYLAVLNNDALADTAPLFGLISRHVNEDLLAELARGHAEGRLLLIGTTNLDAQTPVIWNIGAIAQHGGPRALDLVRRILLASAAIPGAFPPVMIDVELDGVRHQEMHVDGGAFAQAFLYPRAISEARAQRRARGVTVRDARAWVIRNARLDGDWASVDRRFLGIAGRAISTMIFTSGLNDIVRMYASTQQDGVDFNLAYIGADFTTPLPAPFDQGYMRALFDHGYQRGRAGFDWAKRPPFGNATASSPHQSPSPGR